MQLSTSDKTPALEVNLLAASGNSHMSEINLNETAEPRTTSSAAAAASPQVNSSSSDNDESTNVNVANMPHPPPAQPSAAPASTTFELPSYNEALKLKKLEASEIPPSYNSSIGITDTPPIITIDAADVS